MKLLRTINTDSFYIDLEQKYGIRSFKPDGLWYSIDNEWLEWCKENMPEWVRENNFSIEIDDKSLYIVDDIKSLDGLHNKYGYKGDFDPINWGKLKDDYKGIEIRNYSQLKYSLWNQMRGLNHLWISSMDCSSGCIWDLSCVQSVKKVKKKILINS